MADLVITAANVAVGTGAVTASGTAGATITAGQCVYLDPADSKLKLADASVAGTSDTTKGIALHAATNNQPLTYQIGGEMNLGATLVAGFHYFVSDTAGGVIPHADLSTTERAFRLGWAKTTAIFVVDLKFQDVTVA